MRAKNAILLFITAAIWGLAFVAQSVGMDYVGPLTFNCVRSLLGGLVLIPLCLFTGRGKAAAVQDAGREKAAVAQDAGREKAAAQGAQPGSTRNLLLGGLCCGLALCLASNFQQFGIQYTTVGKAGFITACYIVIVPVLGLFFGKKCSPLMAVAVALSLGGLYLLCMTGGGGGLNRGDVLVLVCAFLFSVHIMVIDYFSPMVDGVKMSCIQFFVCGIVSGIGMILFEEPRLSQIFAAWMPVLYAGVMSCGVGYTLQIVGQKGMNPTVASLILSLESSISVLAGWVLLGEQLSMREIFGCALMFGAIVLAQAPLPGAAPVEDGGGLPSGDRRRREQPVDNKQQLG